MITMQQSTFKEHLLELKSRVLKILICFLAAFFLCYYFSDQIYMVLLEPLAKINDNKVRNIIYTGLAEAFFTYLKLAAYSAFVIISPIIATQIYLFIRPGLHSRERKIAAFILFMAPILFWLGSIFVFYYVMPKAWHFFLSFENNNTLMPIILQAKISEYLSLVMQLLIAFGVAFQLPIAILVLNLLKIVTIDSLKKQRRLAIVINFIIAGILTPPDVLSQFALAIPMVLLYELSIALCKFVNRGINVGY